MLGILGLVLCPVLGPIAWIKGNAAMRRINADPGRYTNAGVVQAGRIIGAISTLLVLAGIVAAVIAFALGAGDGESAEARRQEIARCRSEMRVYVTASEAWHQAYEFGRSGFETAWPRSIDDLAAAYSIGESERFTLSGDGSSPPVLRRAPGECEDVSPIQQPR